MPSIPTVVFLSLCVIWGLSWVAIKYSLQDIPPLLGVAGRCALAALTLGLFARFRRKRLLITPRDLRLVALTGMVLYSGNYGLIHWSEQRLTAGVTAVLFSTYPIFVALQNDVLKLAPRQEHWKTYIGLSVCLIGILTLFYEDFFSMRAGWYVIVPSAAVLVASFLAAGMTLFAKHRLSHLDPVTMAYYQLLLGFWPALLLSLSLGEASQVRLKPGSLIALLYLGIFASALAFALFYWLLAQMSAVRLTLFVYITPLVAIGSVWVLLGEVPQPRFLAGTGLVLTGILLCPQPRRASRRSSRREGREKVSGKRPD